MLRRMDERCFRPLLRTVKAELGRGQPGLIRWIWDETLPQSSIDRSTFYSAAHHATKWASGRPLCHVETTQDIASNTEAVTVLCSQIFKVKRLSKHPQKTRIRLPLITHNQCYHIPIWLQRIFLCFYNHSTIETVLLNCCPNFPSCLAHVNSMASVTWAIRVAIKKYSLNFIIAAQIAQPIWKALVGQLEQSGQQ